MYTNEIYFDDRGRVALIRLSDLNDPKFEGPAFYKPVKSNEFELELFDPGHTIYSKAKRRTSPESVPAVVRRIFEAGNAERVKELKRSIESCGSEFKFSEVFKVERARRPEESEDQVH